MADWLIDREPGGGEGGGEVVCAGTPEQVAACERSHTGAFLREIFERDAPLVVSEREAAA